MVELTEEIMNAEESQYLDDLYRLKGTLLSFAVKMLQAEGGFVPFSWAIRNNGVMEAWGANTKTAGAKEIFSMLTGALSSLAKRREIRASAICWDAQLNGTNSDASAVIMSIEYLNGAAMEITVRYERTPTGEYMFHEEEISPADPRIFRTRVVN